MRTMLQKSVREAAGHALRLASAQLAAPVKVEAKTNHLSLHVLNVAARPPEAVLI